MINKDELEKIKESQKEWELGPLEKGEMKEDFTTISGTNWRRG